MKKIRNKLWIVLVLLLQTGCGQQDAAANQKLAELMNAFVDEENAAAQKWVDAGQAVQTKKMLNCEILNSEEEFAHQRKLIQAYIDTTKDYQARSKTLVDRLKERLQPVKGVSNQYEKAIQGVEQDHLRQKPLFDPLLEANIAYGETMMKILDLLETHRKEWVFSGGKTVIYNKQVLEEYGALLKKLDEYGMETNRLSDELSRL